MNEWHLQANKWSWERSQNITCSKVSSSRKNCNKYPWVMLLHNNRHITLHIITAMGPHRAKQDVRHGGGGVATVLRRKRRRRRKKRRRRAVHAVKHTTWHGRTTTEGARSRRLPRPSSRGLPWSGTGRRGRCILWRTNPRPRPAAWPATTAS